MKVIGKMADGSSLAIVSHAEIAAVAVLANGLADGLELVEMKLRREDAAGEAAGPPTERKPRAEQTAREAARPPSKQKAAQGTEAICKQCHKPYEKPKGSLKQCCSKECVKAYAREYARTRWRKKHGKPVDAPVEDADMQKRLEMIRKSVAAANAAKV